MGSVLTTRSSQWATVLIGACMVGPQIVVNDKKVTPANGRWVIEPNKIWEMIKSDADARAAFAFFQIDGRLNELLGVNLQEQSPRPPMTPLVTDRKSVV